jgi:two-component system response regulator PilR (NtrC family)
MDKPRILIVDDEPDICELLEITLSRMGFDTQSAKRLDTARALLSKLRFDLCLTDMRLPDGNGLDLVDEIQRKYPGMPVAVITAHGNTEAAVRALKSGAFDFISKPLDLKNLRQLVASALKLQESGVKPAPLKSDAPLLLGESPGIDALKNTIDKLARSQAPVYIHGESGTGKELVARLIHAKSTRRDKPFVPVNCSAIPSELMESEFFGHIKGSFTGAHADKRGLFAAADGGTLFLDEVAELPIGMQVKLLRAIQERCIRPVGAPAELPADVRVLSATHKNLEDLVSIGEFRQDLYYRINVIRVDVPSLRDRQEDIPLLTDHILANISLKHGAARKTLDETAREALLDYSFPGNVRELENILERAATLCDNAEITEDDLLLPPLTKPVPILRSQANLNDTLARQIDSSQAVIFNQNGPTALDDMLLEQERDSIYKALEQTRWNKTRAAELLGISFRQLRYRIKKLGIE